MPKGFSLKHGFKGKKKGLIHKTRKGNTSIEKAGKITYTPTRDELMNFGIPKKIRQGSKAFLK